jgi:hypothetical protein
MDSQANGKPYVKSFCAKNIKVAKKSKLNENGKGTVRLKNMMNV